MIEISMLLICFCKFVLFCSLLEKGARGKSVRSLCDGSLDQSFMGWTH